MNRSVPGVAQRRHRRTWMWAAIALTALVLLLVAVVALSPFEGRPALEEADTPWPYVAVFGLVLGDAVIPILPGETTLNTASTLAAQGFLELGWVMDAGAAGAVLGDSSLYWIARRNRDRMQDQLTAAMANPKVTTAMEVIGSSAAALLVFGRYVPACASSSTPASDWPGTPTASSCAGPRWVGSRGRSTSARWPSPWGRPSWTTPSPRSWCPRSRPAWPS